jgi:hypothetical protein
VRLLPASPRKRRKLLRLGIVLAFAAAIGFVIAVVDGVKDEPESSGAPRRGQVQRPERPVRVTPEMRREINRTLDRFVPAAVLRRDPMVAYELSTPDMRQAASRKEWRRGEIPVYPFDALGSRFHDWTVNYSVEDNVNVDLTLRASEREREVQGIAYTVDMKRVGGRWLVDSFFPTAQFRRVAAPNGSRIVAQPDLAPQQSEGASQTGERSKALLAFVPLAVVGLGLGLVLSVFLVQGIRSRRAARDYAAGRL